VFVVLLVGAVATTALTLVSQGAYRHNEQRLLNLQTQLTASTLGSAQVDLESRLGKALALASDAPNPAALFADEIAASMRPTGPFATAGLRLVSGGSVRVLSHIGGKTIRNPDGAAATALYERAAKTRSLVTSRIVNGRQQRLSYLLSRKTSQGVLVAAAAQMLPSDRRIQIPPGSPDANLNLAIYFGKAATPAALVEDTTAQLPLSGITAVERVPFGSSVLTIVTSPKGPLGGAWSEFIPWGILIVGVVFTLAISSMTARLDRRRRRAEVLTGEVTALYREQRSISVTLQRALLPKQLPEIPGVEIAALYLPGSAGLEVGGDWYSAIQVDEHRFTFVVGDVSGHGVRAATVMASLRYTSRAFASLGYPPAEVLGMAGKEIDLMTDDHFATVLVGMADIERGEVTLASAGHPAPLLLHRGTAEFLDVPSGAPLGIGSVPYAQVTIPVLPGSTLLGFTDGLVERRGSNIADGLESLRHAATRSHGVSTEDLIGGIVEMLVHPTMDDDVALLGIHWLPPSERA
jgi:hypothetical protein